MRVIGVLAKSAEPDSFATQVTLLTYSRFAFVNRDRSSCFDSNLSKMKPSGRHIVSSLKV